MMRPVEVSDEDKLKMYMKLTKQELAKMLVQNNKIIDGMMPIAVINITPTEGIEVPFSELCSCNPKNGGSGICGCIMANTMVKKSNNYHL